MQPNPNDAPTPRETAAGLVRDGTVPPPTSATPPGAHPEPSRQPVHDHKQVPADRWNQ